MRFPWGFVVATLLSAVIDLIDAAAASIVLGLGIWLKTRGDGTSCMQYLSTPIIVVSAIIFVVAIDCFIGARNNNTCLLRIYVFLKFVALMLLLAFTIFAFIVTNENASETISDKGIAQYKLGDYSSWLQKRVNSTSNWAKIKACLQDSKVCNQLSKFNSSEAIGSANLPSVVDGCCIPPPACNFTLMNSTFWEIPGNISAFSNHDCNIWSNQPSIACFNCDSCKAGVLQGVKKNWRMVAYANLVLFFVLLFLRLLPFIAYSISCCAYRLTETTWLQQRVLRPRSSPRMEPKSSHLIGVPPSSI